LIEVNYGINPLDIFYGMMNQMEAILSYLSLTGGFTTKENKVNQINTNIEVFKVIFKDNSNFDYWEIINNVLREHSEVVSYQVIEPKDIDDVVSKYLIQKPATPKPKRQSIIMDDSYKSISSDIVNEHDNYTDYSGWIAGFLSLGVLIVFLFILL